MIVRLKHVKRVRAKGPDLLVSPDHRGAPAVFRATVDAGRKILAAELRDLEAEETAA